jgi:hypothetical protein
MSAPGPRSPKNRDQADVEPAPVIYVELIEKLQAGATPR